MLHELGGTRTETRLEAQGETKTSAARRASGTAPVVTAADTALVDCAVELWNAAAEGTPADKAESDAVIDDPVHHDCEPRRTMF